MGSGFHTIKDLLETILIPITLTLISLFWPTIQSRFNRIKFEAFILRELGEIDPTKGLKPNGKWNDHLEKTFIHQKLLEDPSSCYTLLLSLDADLIYRLNQLWGAFERADSEKWRQYYYQLALKFPCKKRRNLKKVFYDWIDVMEYYEPKIDRTLYDFGSGRLPASTNGLALWFKAKPKTFPRQRKSNRVDFRVK